MLINLEFKSDDPSLVSRIVEICDKMNGLEVLECTAFCSNDQVVKLSYYPKEA